MKNKKLRVLYIQKTPTGGSVISLFELLRGLDIDIYDPVILFFEPSVYRAQFEEIGVKVINLRKNTAAIKPISTKRDIAKSLSYLSGSLAECYRNAKQIYSMILKDWFLSKKIAPIIKKEKIDIVHHNNGFSKNMANIIAAQKMRIPQICHIRKFENLSFVDKFMARYIKYFFYISKAVEKYFCDQGISSRKGELVYNPFDPNYFIVENKNLKLFDEFDLKKHNRLITNIGRLDWWKGHEYFLKAIAEVRETEKNVKALIVGSPDNTLRSTNYYRMIKRLAYELKIEKHVIFAGFRSDIPQILSATDILVHSSSEPEPFGRVVVEGMLSGLPVIATSAGGIREIIEDKVTGILVPLKNSTAMAKAIIHLLKMPLIAKKMGELAQKNAATRFSSKENLNKVQRVYQNVSNANLCADIHLLT